MTDPVPAEDVGCGQPVILKSDGSWSRCVKGLFHAGPDHEDYLGNVRTTFIE